MFALSISLYISILLQAIGGLAGLMCPWGGDLTSLSDHICLPYNNQERTANPLHLESDA